MNTTKLIATYARVSTSHQEEQETINAQTEALKEYASINGLTIIQEYKDEGWSGDSLARPSLDKLREEAKSAPWEGVLIYDPDRLARRYSYQELVMDELKEAGIEVMYITISAPKNSEDKILYGVRGLFAEYERTKITERFRLGKIRKLKEGHIIISEPPFGYNYVKKNDTTNGYLTINQEEAKVIKMIFNWIINDRLSIRKVIVKLKELNIKPRKSLRGVWSTSTMTNLLRNEVYFGNAYWGKSGSIVAKSPKKMDKYRKNKKTSRYLRPKTDWYKVEVPAIISEETFQAARQILMQNQKLSPRCKKNEYLLAGKIYCICGRRRVGEGPQKGKHLYYRCSDKIYNFPLPQQCFEKTVNARIVDEVVWQTVVELLTNKDELICQLKIYQNKFKNDYSSYDDEIEVLRTQIKKQKEEEHRFNKAYGAGIYTLEKLRGIIDPIQKNLTIAEKRLNELELKKKHQLPFEMPDENAIDSLINTAKLELNNLSFSGKKDIIVRVIEKVEAKQGELTLTGYLPIPINNHVKLRSNHRYGLNATLNLIHSTSTLPFKTTKVIPMPLVRGVHYGFLKNAS